MKKRDEYDGVIRSETFLDGDRIVNRKTQPNRRAILEHNARLRAEPDVLKHASFGGLELNIPELDYWRLIRANPELNSLDPVERTKAWKAFFYSEAATPYRVRDRVRKPRLSPTAAAIASIRDQVVTDDP